MKIVVIAGAYPPIRCGTAEYTQQLCKSLVAQGLDVDLITTDIPQLGGIKSQAQHFNICPVVPKWSFRALPILLRIVDQTTADIVHIEYPTIPYGHHVMINFLPFVLKRQRPSRPTVTRLHEFSIAHPLRKLSTVPLILGSNKVAVPADVEAAAIRRALSWAASKLVVIPVGTNIDVLTDPEFDRSQWRAKLGVASGQLLLGYFGMISKSKDIEVLLCALRQVRDDGLDTKLLMIGDLNPGKDWYHRKTYELIRSLGLSREIIFTGFCAPEDVSRHLQGVDVMVLLFKDGVSTRRGTFMAAIAHGLAVVTTLKGNRPDGLCDHENALLVPVGDVQATASAISELASSPELRTKLAWNALLYSQRFSWFSIGAATAKLYSQLLKKDMHAPVPTTGSEEQSQDRDFT